MKQVLGCVLLGLLLCSFVVQGFELINHSSKWGLKKTGSICKIPAETETVEGIVVSPRVCPFLTADDNPSGALDVPREKVYFKFLGAVLAACRHAGVRLIIPVHESEKARCKAVIHTGDVPRTVFPNGFDATAAPYLGTNVITYIDKVRGTYNFVPGPSLSVWARDFVPLPCRDAQNQKHSLLVFNQDYIAEGAIANAVIGHLGGPVHDFKDTDAHLAFEWGNLASNGAGVCAACFANYFVAAKGKDVGAERVKAFQKFLYKTAGCRAMLEFESLPLDNTGHVDLFFNFLGANKVVVATFTEQQLTTIEGYDHAEARRIRDIVQNNQDELDALIDLSGYKDLQIVRVPMHSTSFDATKKRIIYRTYANSAVINGANGIAVLLPDYGTDPRGTLSAAKAAYTAALGEVQFFTFDAEPLIQTGGAAHCMTKHIFA